MLYNKSAEQKTFLQTSDKLYHSKKLLKHNVNSFCKASLNCGAFLYTKKLFAKNIYSVLKYIMTSESRLTYRTFYVERTTLKKDVKGENKMENIKKLLGDAYKEDMTLEDVDKALEGKKLVDLSTGEYVAKAKYDTLETKHKNLQSEHAQVVEQTKDYETLKAENDTFKAEKANSELKGKIVALGIKENAFKYVKGDIDAKELELTDDEETNKENVKKYLEAHPEFAEKPADQQKPADSQTPPVFVDTNLQKQPQNDGSPKVVATHSWNKNRGL